MMQRLDGDVAPFHNQNQLQLGTVVHNYSSTVRCTVFHYLRIDSITE